MGVLEQQQDMIALVAIALDDLIDDVVFVGGCVTGLLVNDAFTLEQVRFTEDVDLIVNVITQSGWRQMQKKLRHRGFKEDMSADVICRMNLANLIVDVMPIEEHILGFSNQWYKAAMAHPLNYEIKPDLTVNIISSVYFIATKIDAYLNRGQGDVLASHDVEDLLTVFDGRSSIVNEIKQAQTIVRQYIIDQMSLLLDNEHFEYAVQSVARGDMAREQLIMDRIQACIKP